MNLVVYSDESGTHDLKAQQPGANVAVLAGYAGLTDDWDKFCGEWQNTLNEYGVPVFHFSQFSDKKKCAKNPKSPYHGWSKERRHEFLFKMAAIAGKRVRFPFAASFHLADYHNAPDIKSQLRHMGLTDAQINGQHLVYSALFYDFFDICRKEIEIHKPNFSGSISFIFDRKDGDAYWLGSANQMFTAFAHHDLRFREIKFEDKKKEIPLQAADMIAYRIHQIRENQFKSKDHYTLSPLDYELWGNFKDSKEFMEHLRKLFGHEIVELEPNK